MLMHFNLQTPHAEAEMGSQTPGPPRAARRAILLGMASVSPSRTPDSRCRHPQGTRCSRGLLQSSYTYVESISLFWMEAGVLHLMYHVAFMSLKSLTSLTNWHEAPALSGPYWHCAWTGCATSQPREYASLCCRHVVFIGK